MDVDVTWEDQQRINKFGRSNQRLHDLEADVSKWQEELENLDDAATEVMVADEDEPMRYMIGKVFVLLPPDEVDTRIEARKDEIEAKIAEAEEEIESLRETMAELKVVLYAKFKSSINLEENPKPSI